MTIDKIKELVICCPFCQFLGNLFNLALHGCFIFIGRAGHHAKILIADDVVDDWQDYLDLMVESVISNSGRSCINCSGIWASRHTREIADAADVGQEPDRLALDRGGRERCDDAEMLSLGRRQSRMTQFRIQKKGPRYGALLLRSRNFLERYDVLSLRAFLTLSYRKLNFLTFRKRFEAFSSDCTEMYKNIRS